MKVPLNWLNDYVEITVSTDKLIDRLTAVGLAYESMDKIENDIVLDLEVTPNRPDWLSLIGIAREVAVIQDTDLTIPDATLPDTHGSHSLRFIPDKQGCIRYSAVVIENVTVAPSPDWLRTRLRQVGMRPINNLVDISNYVMVETGNPNHFFDLDTVSGNRMEMTRTGSGEYIVTVDEEKQQLPENTLVMRDTEKIIDLCGIKGGGVSKISEETENIVIHVPVYDPTLIRKTSKEMNLSSDASYIYERGADPGGTLNTLARLVELTLQLAGGDPIGEIIDTGKKPGSRRISLPVHTIAEFTGASVSQEEIVRILTGLDLKPEIQNGRLTTMIPSYRADLTIPEDIVEEVIRHYGYNRISKTLPSTSYRPKPIPYEYHDRFVDKIKRVLTAMGFSEIYTYSLLSNDDIKHLEHDPKHYLKLTNPVNNDYQYLQKTLLNNLIKAVSVNRPHHAEINLFELGRVFSGSSAAEPDEHREIAAVSNMADFASFKGKLEAVAKELNTELAICTGAQPPMYAHPGRWGSVMLNDELLGEIGEMHPKVLDQSNTDVDKLMFFALNADLLQQYYTEDITFIPPSPYPAAIEDLTLILPDRTGLGAVIDAVTQHSNLVSELTVIDRFENTVTIRIFFKSHEGNLTGEKLAKLRAEIKKLLNDRFSIGLKDKKD